MGARQVLKAGRARTVLLRGSAGDRAVVKRFHHPGALQSLRDQARARSEYRLLGALRERGVRVPRPLDVRHADGAWEVEMEWIEDARPLSALLAERPSGRALAPLAAPLGRLLAQAHAAGLDHPDLHPENVVLDRSGAPWLLDVDKARLRPALREAHAWRDLVSLAASVRERTSPAFRARAALAWRRHAPPEIARALDPPHEALARLEAAARLHRRSVARRTQERWLRGTRLCRVSEEPGATRYLSRRADEATLRLLEGLPPTPPPRGALTCCGTRFVVHADTAWPRVRARWCAAARLVEHDLPVLQPLCAVRAAESWVAFRRSARGPLALAVALELRPRQVGALLGALHDRGLDVERLELEDDGARLLLAPPPRLLRLDPLAPDTTPARRLRALAGAVPSPAARSELRAGYLAAFPVPSERARIAASLGERDPEPGSHL